MKKKEQIFRNLEQKIIIKKLMQDNPEIKKYLDSLNKKQIAHLEILSRPSQYRNKNLKFLQTITYDNQDIFFEKNANYMSPEELVEVNDLKREKKTTVENSFILGTGIGGIYFISSLRNLSRNSSYVFKLLNGVGIGIFLSCNYYFYNLNDINNRMNIIFYNTVRKKLKSEKLGL